MTDSTLTIIVPCYNVSRYLEKCVKSLLTQKYQDIDILLIDDGSTDATPSLCDQLALANNRIRVIHQCNMGLPITRENGIKNTEHEYITFVDADDWIHPDMYYNMMNAILKENVDVAQCGVCDVYPDGIQKHRYQDFYNNIYIKYNHTDGFSKLIEEKEWRSYMWNKIFRKGLFKNVIFPIGRGLDEDTSVMHQIFHHAQSSIYFKDEYYFYFHRPNSICNDSNISSITKKCYDRVNARLERYEFVSQYPEYNHILPYLKSMTVSMCIAGLRTVVRYPSYFPKNYYYKLRKQILSIPIQTREMDKEWISKAKKMELIYLKYFPIFYKKSILSIYKFMK